MIKTRHKQSKDENFPVGKLISKKLRHLVKAYYKAARSADDIADNPDLSSKDKMTQLDDAERAFYGKESLAKSYPEMFELGKLFQKENLSVGLYTDLLVAFRRDSENQKIEIWEQLLDYCKYSAAPVGRFVLAIHDENPATYLPAETLCAVLQIVNHLQDMKYDAISNKRFYLPRQMMQHYGVVESDIFLNKCSQPLKLLIDDICQRLRKMLDDAAILPAIVKSLSLKAELGVIISLTNSMLKRIEKGDVLTTEIKLSSFDWFKAMTIGALSGLFCRVKNFRTRI